MIPTKFNFYMVVFKATGLFNAYIYAWCYGYILPKFARITVIV